MEKVVGIIDMGDYQINKKFFSKDLGALKIGFHSRYVETMWKIDGRCFLSSTI
jgi:hypothetical protein